jgi:hypothetical protein
LAKRPESPGAKICDRPSQRVRRAPQRPRVTPRRRHRDLLQHHWRLLLEHLDDHAQTRAGKFAAQLPHFGRADAGLVRDQRRVRLSE